MMISQVARNLPNRRIAVGTTDIPQSEVNFHRLYVQVVAQGAPGIHAYAQGSLIHAPRGNAETSVLTVQAKFMLEFTGTARKDGVLKLAVGGNFDEGLGSFRPPFDRDSIQYEIRITKGMTGEQVASKVSGAINRSPKAKIEYDSYLRGKSWRSTIDDGNATVDRGWVSFDLTRRTRLAVQYHRGGVNT